MDLERVPSKEDPRSTPLTAKRVFYGSPPQVEMTLTEQQGVGLAWLLNRLAGERVMLQHWGGTWVGVDVVGDDNPLRRKQQYAIWDTTGAVYKLDSYGAVEDDPIYDPSR